MMHVINNCIYFLNVLKNVKANTDNKKGNTTANLISQNIFFSSGTVAASRSANAP